MRVLVVIPAFNEADAIGLVLHDIPRDLVEEVVVVSNGSTDATAATARAAGATVLHEPKRGYGYACLRGIEYARQRQPDILVFLDGDYSDHPEELRDVIAPILANKADFVIGSRMQGRRERGALLLQARFGNWLAGKLLHLFWGADFTDLGPFRAVRFRELLALEMEDGTFGWTIEMQIKAVLAGLRTAEVPVSYRRRIGKSKVTGTLSGTVKASAKILWTIAKYAWVTRKQAPQPLPQTAQGFPAAPRTN